jgi:hypothetical protein
MLALPPASVAEGLGAGVALVQFAGVDVGYHAAAHEEFSWTVATRRLDEPLVFLVAGQHGLHGPVAHHVAAEVLRASVVHEVLEVGEGLGDGEAELVVAQLIREDPAGDLERGRRLTRQGSMHRREALFVMADELVYAAVEVVEERAVSGEDEVDIQAAQALDGVEVALQGPRGRVGPEADVGRNLQQQMIPYKE